MSRYYRRYRYRSSGGQIPPGAVAAVAAVVLLGAAGKTVRGGQPAPRPSIADASAAPLPRGAFPGRRPWAADFLRAARLPVTPCNVSAVIGQEAAEDSNARFNPLDTERQMQGNTLYNSAGVRNYVSLAQGLTASVLTLYNGRYPAVIAALRAGNDAQRVASAVAASPWGTETYEASC